MQIYSTFNSYTNLRSVFDNINSASPYQHLDTLNFYQINKSGMLNFTYSFERNGLNHNSAIAISGNQSDNIQNETNQLTTFINSSLNHTISIPSNGLSMAIAVLYTTNNSFGNINNTYGPFLSATKSLFEGVFSFTLSGAYNQTVSNNIKDSENLNFRLGSILKVKENHNIGISGGWFRFISETRDVDKNELLFNVSYSYNFSRQFSRKDKSAKKDL